MDAYRNILNDRVQRRQMQEKPYTLSNVPVQANAV